MQLIYLLEAMSHNARQKVLQDCVGNLELQGNVPDLHVLAIPAPLNLAERHPDVYSHRSSPNGLSRTGLILNKQLK